MDNFCDKGTETTLHEICMQGFLRFSDSIRPSQSVSLIYEFAWLAGISKSEENLLKTSCKDAPVTKVAHIFWWRHDNRNNRQVRVNVDATFVAIFRIKSCFTKALLGLTLRTFAEDCPWPMNQGTTVTDLENFCRRLSLTHEPRHYCDWPWELLQETVPDPWTKALQWLTLRTFAEDCPWPMNQGTTMTDLENFCRRLSLTHEPRHYCDWPWELLQKTVPDPWTKALLWLTLRTFAEDCPWPMNQGTTVTDLENFCRRLSLTHEPRHYNDWPWELLHEIVPDPWTKALQWLTLRTFAWDCPWPMNQGTTMTDLENFCRRLSLTHDPRHYNDWPWELLHETVPDPWTKALQWLTLRTFAGDCPWPMIQGTTMTDLENFCSRLSLTHEPRHYNDWPWEHLQKTVPDPWTKALLWLTLRTFVGDCPWPMNQGTTMTDLENFCMRLSLTHEPRHYCDWPWELLHEIVPDPWTKALLWLTLRTFAWDCPWPMNQGTTVTDLENFCMRLSLTHDRML